MSVVNGTFLIVTSASLTENSIKVTLNGYVVVKNNNTAYGGGIGCSGEGLITAIEIGFGYNGSKVTSPSANSTSHLYWSGVIIA